MKPLPSDFPKPHLVSAECWRRTELLWRSQGFFDVANMHSIHADNLERHGATLEMRGHCFNWSNEHSGSLA